MPCVAGDGELWPRHQGDRSDLLAGAASQLVYRTTQIAAFQRLCDGSARHDLDATMAVYTEDVHYEEQTLRWNLADLPERAAEDMGLSPTGAYRPFVAQAANGRGRPGIVDRPGRLKPRAGPSAQPRA